MNKILC